MKSLAGSFFVFLYTFSVRGEPTGNVYDEITKPVQSVRVAEGITGTVTNSAGRPVAGVLVHAEAISEPRPAVPEIAIVTDRHGRYTWRLFPGVYAITISAQGYRKLTKEARVEPAKQTTLDFRLEPDR